ncbi:MAG: biopolymer transporter ExbD [Bdellovibrionales bacterium]|nr:biopolymer transporter ExbD [Bdellovibrionales bacterium]
MAAELPDAEHGGPIASINVTPFVDVVLVLLVIFMVTAPMLMKDVLGIRLPKSVSADAQKPTTFGVAVNRAGQILLDGIPVDQEGLTRRAKDTLALDPEVQAVIAADGDARHEDVVRAIDWVQQAGMKRFGLQIQRER